MTLSIYREPVFDCVPKLVFLQMAIVLISRSAKLLVGSMPSVSIKRHNAEPYDKIFRHVPDVFLFLLRIPGRNKPSTKILIGLVLLFNVFRSM